MSKKKIFIVIVIVILIIIVGLWISGIIPKQIAKIYGNSYMNNHFPEMQLKYDSIEWSKNHDDYIITFKDKVNNTHSCTVGPKYFPINLGQGLFAIEEAYREKLEEKKEDEATKIEVKSAENFEILFKVRQPIDSYNKIYAILDKSETKKYNYTIYAYDGSVNIRIGGKEYSLREALLENRITMEEIIQKANKDLPNAASYDDGGSKEYHYENYTIIKCNTLNGNRDVYIGTKDMTLNDVL